MQRACPSPKKGASLKERKQHRECLASHFYTTPLYKKTIERYPVDIKIDTINGVYTEVFMPKEGTTKENQNKVLISLHSGAFQFDSRTASRIESIPIAALSGIKVISIDYRMGPEHQFPAASEDVTTVYKSLLEKYKPQNIGIYGTAAGAQLVSQALAWFQKEKPSESWRCRNDRHGSSPAKTKNRYNAHCFCHRRTSRNRSFHCF